MTDEKALKIALSALHDRRRREGAAFGSELQQAIFVLEGLHASAKEGE